MNSIMITCYYNRYTGEKHVINVMVDHLLSLLHKRRDLLQLINIRSLGNNIFDELDKT